MTKTFAWHFLYEGHKLRDGRDAPADGVWLEHDGDVVICESGLHASRRPADALSYAPGPILCLVECDGIAEEHGDKLVCRRRKIVARMDATDMLRYYARMQALSVVHLWDPPQIVLDYLMTGDSSLKDAARATAWAAAKAAARAAARDAAWAAASAAASDAAWAATSDAASDAAWAATRAAARATAWAAAKAATSDAASDAAWAATRAEFDALVFECFADYLVENGDA